MGPRQSQQADEANKASEATKANEADLVDKAIDATTNHDVAKGQVATKEHDAAKGRDQAEGRSKAKGQVAAKEAIWVCPCSLYSLYSLTKYYVIVAEVKEYLELMDAKSTGWKRFELLALHQILMSRILPQNAGSEWT